MLVLGVVWGRMVAGVEGPCVLVLQTRDSTYLIQRLDGDSTSTAMK